MLNIDSAVIREHSPALLAFAYRVVHQREEAEDLVQETWISAMRSMASFEGRASLRTWLTRILQRRIADNFRKRRPFAELAEEMLIDPVAPEDSFDARELADRAALRFESLTPLEQRAVLLDLQQVERDEAAETLGITRGHLRVLMFRARQKLELALDGARP